MRIPVLSYEPSRARIPLWGWIVGEHGADGYVSLEREVTSKRPVCW